MTNPRHIAKATYLFPSYRPRWRVWDTVKGCYLPGYSYHKRSIEKRCDRYNAKILVEAEKYRKAKDNG